MYRKLLLIITLLLVCGLSYAAKNYASVTADKLPVHSKPSPNAPSSVSLKKGAGVEVLEKKNGWAKVRLAEGGTGYVKNSGLKATSKKPEAADTDIQIKQLLDKFNKAVAGSNFATEKKIVPSLTLTSAKGSTEATLLYSAVDQDGKKVPSLKKNPLAKNMRELIELTFLKMMKSREKDYKITVETPYFGAKGVINGSVTYAVFTMTAEKEQINQVEQGKMSIWSLIRSSKKLGLVFDEYPR